jgi:hypothetical protein
MVERYGLTMRDSGLIPGRAVQGRSMIDQHRAKYKPLFKSGPGGKHFFNKHKSMYTVDQAIEGDKPPTRPPAQDLSSQIQEAAEFLNTMQKCGLIFQAIRTTGGMKPVIEAALPGMSVHTIASHIRQLIEVGAIEQPYNNKAYYTEKRFAAGEYDAWTPEQINQVRELKSPTGFLLAQAVDGGEGHLPVSAEVIATETEQALMTVYAQLRKLKMYDLIVKSQPIGVRPVEETIQKLIAKCRALCHAKR